MTLHLLKLCVGCESIAELRQWQRERAAEARRRGRPYTPSHWTRSMPKRRDEVLDGGSLYWVIEGFVSVRQRVVGLDPKVDKDGRPYCLIRFGRRLVPTDPRPHRPFQGWRYLEPAQAPPDFAARGGGGRAPSVKMLADLRALGLL